ASLDSSASLEPIKIQQQTPPNQEAGAQAAGQEPASTQANQGPTREPVLPDAIAGAQPAPEGTTPFQIPGLQGQIGLRETQDPAQPPQEQRHPPAPADNAIDPPPPIEETPRENNGIVDIRISSGSPSLGGTQPAPNNLEALLQAARSQYMLGRYPEAARTFERALQAGGDAGAINQRLGQCYEKMGQPTQAVAAYQKAIAAYEAVERSGAGGERVKTALDATRQALRVLQGSS
ncbi:MAG TPA: tetratricopeptide repeat protein, partial [Fimbriimonadaceae bacterium]|nr:tetratricopeptide repeat protein [Fimbriimonadaceae bacterium]